MPDNTNSNPYRAPAVAEPEPLRTLQGHTVGGCTAQFALIGAVAGVTSGVVMAALDLLGFNATAIMLAPGLAFGAAVVIAIDRYVGSLAVHRRIILVPGCLAGFGIIGAILELTSTNIASPSMQQPLVRYASYLSASATGLLLITILILWVTQSFHWKSHLALWALGSAIGFVGIFVVIEFGGTTGSASIPIVTANTVFQVVVPGAIGWQLAVAQLSQVRDEQT